MAATGMFVGETIAEIRRAYFSLGKPIEWICRDYACPAKIVRKIIRSNGAFDVLPVAATELRWTLW